MTTALRNPFSDRLVPQPPEAFEAVIQAAAGLAREYLAAAEDRAVPVIEYLPPEDLRRKLTLAPPARGRPLEELVAEARTVLRYSARTGHPRFFNQLFGGIDPAAVLGEWITALLNTSMYTYEVAPVATLMELALLERMNQYLGFTAGEGVFAPGGSLSNLMAVLAARHHRFPHVKREGLRGDERPVIFASAEGHYSVPRAASVAGLGVEAVVEVGVDQAGRMLPAELERAVERVRAEGRTPFLVAATSGTTVAGAFDPLDAIAAVAERHGLWFHVDASYGGTVLFSPAHRHLMAGVARADSVTWNPHKMMGVPLLCSALLLRERGRLAGANSMRADYLFHGEDGSACDLGDLSLQCGRRVDALKLWLSWQALGDEGYSRRVDRLFALAATFRRLLDQRPGFRLVREPDATNVCFRYLPPGDRAFAGDARLRREHDVTRGIRQRMLERGRFMINYATLDGAATFRIVLNNPRATEEDLAALLDEIETVGGALPPA